VKGVKKCFISNAMNGTDNMLWNGSEEHDDDVRSECDEATDCADGNSDIDW
jgi:hypothetical protein